jgi:hypothetical protein
MSETPRRGGSGRLPQRELELATMERAGCRLDGRTGRGICGGRGWQNLMLALDRFNLAEWRGHIWWFRELTHSAHVATVTADAHTARRGGQMDHAVRRRRHAPVRPEQQRSVITRTKSPAHALAKTSRHVVPATGMGDAGTTPNQYDDAQFPSQPAHNGSKVVRMSRSFSEYIERYEQRTARVSATHRHTVRRVQRLQQQRKVYAASRLRRKHAEVGTWPSTRAFEALARPAENLTAGRLAT